MKVLIFILLLFPVPILAQNLVSDGESITNWKLVGEATQAPENRVLRIKQFFWSPDTITRNEEIIKLWLRVTLDSGTIGDLKKVNEVRMNGRMNCETGDFESTTLIIYF